MKATILYDGVCKFCNRSIAFVINHDPKQRFQFAALQSDWARANLPNLSCDIPSKSSQELLPLPDSVILIEGGKLYTESTAALRIARRLSGAWPALSMFMIVPRPIRDAAYRWIASNRYRWFGRHEACPLPSPQFKRRFIDQADDS